MVTAGDREHFRRIAEFEARLNREAIHECAARTAGENIALGFALSEFASAFGADLAHGDEVSPSRLWRERVLRRASNP